MKRFFKILGIVVLLLIVGGAITYFVVDEPLPEGQPGDEAEALADKMLAALNKPAFDQLATISWTFRQHNTYVWDKAVDSVTVSWSNVSARIHTGTHKGEATERGAPLSTLSDRNQEICDQAWNYFCNDSFWLLAPYKVRDPGTVRKVVETDNGPALLVTYESGGNTPGDSYLWHLSDNGMPTAWQIWASVLPIGGLEFSWENWKSYNGAMLCGTHNGPGPAALSINNISAE